MWRRRSKLTLAPEAIAARRLPVARVRCTDDAHELGFQDYVFIALKAHSVPGVVAVDLDALYLGATPSLQTRLLAQAMRVGGGTALATGP